jgi:ribosomal protein S18 acetylase RimI-like enzyme
LCNSEIEQDLRIGEIQPEAAGFINSVWEFSETGEDSLNFIQWLIETQPSLALYENNTLRAYMLGQYDGSMGMLYVDPSHRKRGLAKYVITEMARKMIEERGYAYVFVVGNNQVSYELHQKCGFKEVCNTLWVHYSPPGAERIIHKKCT